MISDGFLTKLPLVQRGELVTSVVDKLIEKGELSEMVKLVYGPTPAKGVYEGHSTLPQRILDRIKTAKNMDDLTCNLGHLDEGIRIALFKEFTSAQLEEFARLLPESDTGRKLLYDINHEFGDEQRKSLELFRANRALQDGDYESAYKTFRKQGRTADIDALYQKIIAEPDWLKIDLALDISRESFGEQSAARLRDVMTLVLTDKVQERYDLHCKRGDVAKMLLGESLQGTFSTSVTERQQLRDIIASNVSVYELGNVDDEIRLTWAKLHTKDEPASAYGVMAQQGYNGQELLDAARSGLLRNEESHLDRERLTVSDIGKDVLGKLYKRDLPQNLRIGMARVLGATRILRRMSQEIYRATTQPGELRKPRNNGYDLQRAYDLWIEGEGSLDSPHFKNVRASLLGMTESGWFKYDPKDTEGRILWYETALTHHPEHAYKLAHNENDAALMARARSGIVGKDAKAALKFFAGQKDDTGVALAEEALAKKYGLPVESVKPYVTLLLKNDR